MATTKRSFSRRDKISGPFKECPACKATQSLGVSILIGLNSFYTRECTECNYRENIVLPPLRKKVVYLDQFVLSNLVKLLNKSDPGHPRVAIDPFWGELFIKLERAWKSQAVVFPDSFYHRSESLATGESFRLMKYLYEHFSGGNTFHPGPSVEQMQLRLHFANWIKGQKTQFTFEPLDIAFGNSLYGWNIGHRLSIGGGQPQLEELNETQTTNQLTRQQLAQIWSRWQSEKDVKFNDRAEEEVLGLGNGAIRSVQDYFHRCSAASERMATDPNYTPNSGELFPPPSLDLINGLHNVAIKEGVEISDAAERVHAYLTDARALLEVPALKISTVMWAGLGRRAALGEKNPPKSTADVGFISSYLPYCDALFVDIQSRGLLKELPRDLPSHLKLSEFGAEVFSLNQRGEFLKYLDDAVEGLSKEHLAILRDARGDGFTDPYWMILEHRIERNLRTGS